MTIRSRSALHCLLLLSSLNLCFSEFAIAAHYCTPSPDEKVITVGSSDSITDTGCNIWTINPNNTGQVYENSSPAGTSWYVIEIAYVSGTVWQENSANLWWYWQNGIWQGGDGISQSPLSGDSEGSSGSSGGGAQESGFLYWGADIHLDRPPYTNTSITQIALDLTNIFGNNAVARGECGTSASNAESNVRTLAANGVIPICLIPGLDYPDWGSFQDESSAYSWGYSAAQSYVQTVQDATIFEIGNEWDLQVNNPNDLSSPSQWRATSQYPLMRGAAAGAVAAIRDSRPDAAVIVGANCGWDHYGLPVALSEDLQDYNGQNLNGDYVNLHWYNDLDGEPAGIQMGDPSNFNGGDNIFAALKPTGIPIALTEFGSNGGSTADGNSDIQQMQWFLDNVNTTSSGSGVRLGTIYQLYPSGGSQGGENLFRLYNSPGSISDSGTVVKSWILSYGNPSPN